MDPSNLFPKWDSFFELLEVAHALYPNLSNGNNKCQHNTMNAHRRGLFVDDSKLPLKLHCICHFRSISRSLYFLDFVFENLPNDSWISGVKSLLSNLQLFEQ